MKQDFFFFLEDFLFRVSGIDLNVWTAIVNPENSQSFADFRARKAGIRTYARVRTRGCKPNIICPMDKLF